MHSDFALVPLDRIRYSLVWEDGRTLTRALQIKAADEVMMITSAGTNVLNALLRGPRRVVAVDLNPTQNALLRLQAHIIAHHPPEVLRGLLGLAGMAAVARAWATVAPTLPAKLAAYWAAFFDAHPTGILPAGRLETYLHGFLPALSAPTQQRFRELLTCPTIEAQAAHFRRHLHGGEFEERFRTYFDEANLSQGRDPRLFRHAPESGGAAFYDRLAHQLTTRLLRTDFFGRFFFFGAEGMPERLLPAGYQRRNYARLRAALPVLELHTGEAVEYLLSPAGTTITKASLSNIFEYVSPADCQRALASLGNRAGVPLRFVFWNLLQDQTAGEPAEPLPARAAALTSADGCFYFRNVRVYQAEPGGRLRAL